MDRPKRGSVYAWITLSLNALGRVVKGRFCGYSVEVRSSDPHPHSILFEESSYEAGSSDLHAQEPKSLKHKADAAAPLFSKVITVLLISAVSGEDKVSE